MTDQTHRDMAVDFPTKTPRCAALATVQAACRVHEEAWAKLGKVIALQRVLGEDPTSALRLRASASQKITFYNRLFQELNAATDVVGPPSLEDVEKIRALVTQVENLSVADAASAAGLGVIEDALRQSAASVKGVKAA